MEIDRPKDKRMAQRKLAHIFKTIAYCFFGVGAGVLSLFIMLVIRGDYQDVRNKYSKNFLLEKIIDHRIEVEKKAKLTTLNYYIPSFDILADYIHHPQNPDQVLLRGDGGFINYYEKIIEFFPHMPEAHAMLGFLYYFAEENEKSIAAYQRAIALNPQYFWSHYNLGIIHFKDARYQLASDSFQKAITTKPDMTLKSIFSSKIYQQILMNINDQDYSLMQDLRTGYRDSYQMLVLSNYYMNNFSRMFHSSRMALNAHIENPDIFYYYQGLAAFQLKDYDQSVSLLMEAISRNPDHSNSHHYLGLSLKAIGKDVVGGKVLQKAAILAETNNTADFDENNFELKFF